MMNRKWETYHGEELIDSGFHEVTWAAVRSARDDALKDSDWRAVKDRVLPTVWKEYRSALRDLPQNHEDANSAADSFPIPPE